jgi:hypothetical protein
MATREIAAFDEAGLELEAPQGADTYLAKKPAHFEAAITTDSTIDGRDVAADGALAASAVQPGDIGTAAAENVGYFATTAQGALADSAVQPADNISTLAGDSDDLTEGSVQLFLTVAERAQIANLDGWRDLEMSVVGSASGPAAPTLTAFGPGGTIKQLAFAVNDSVYMCCHVPHDIKPSSTMYLHVHWSTDGTNVNPIKWQIIQTEAAGHNQENFGAEVTLTLEEAAQGTAWRHMITEDTVGIATVEVDSLIFIELKRITNGAVENTDDTFALFVDFHYETQQFATPSRVPDFYS